MLAHGLEPLVVEVKYNNVGQVHAVTLDGDVGDEPGKRARGVEVQTSDEREESNRHHQHVDGAESPAEFQFGNDSRRVDARAEDAGSEQVAHDERYP